MEVEEASYNHEFLLFPGGPSRERTRSFPLTTTFSRGEEDDTISSKGNPCAFPRIHTSHALLLFPNSLFFEPYSPNLFAIYLSQSFHTLYHIFALEKYKLNNTTSESCVKFIQSISRNYSRRKLINYQPSRKLQFNSIRGGKADEIEGIRSNS